MPKTGAYRRLDINLSAEDRVKSLWQDLATDPAYQGFDTTTLKAAKFVAASNETQSTEWEFTVTPQLCNKGGNLHGGAAATMLDNLTSTALLTIAKPGHLEFGHVSRTLHTTYLRPVPNGTKVKVLCRVIAAGKNTANVYGEIRTMDGKICVTCVHDKAVFQAPKL